MGVGRGGALVEMMTFNRRVVGSTPALAVTEGPWASPLPAVACALRRETLIQYPCCSRERLWVVEDLKGRYRNGRNEWMNECKSLIEAGRSKKNPARNQFLGDYFIIFLGTWAISSPGKFWRGYSPGSHWDMHPWLRQLLVVVFEITLNCCYVVLMSWWSLNSRVLCS